MKKYIILFSIFVISASLNLVNAQSISQSLGLYVFPAKDQNAATQEADETACFKWAKEQSGYDPMNPTVYKAAEVDTSPMDQWLEVVPVEQQEVLPLVRLQVTLVKEPQLVPLSVVLLAEDQKMLEIKWNKQAIIKRPVSNSGSRKRL